MSDAQSLPQLVTELQVSAHLMQLDAGVYCVYHTPGSMPPDPMTGLPGARLTLPPGPASRGVTITGFRDDGWLGPLDSAALIRVTQGPAQVLMTIYQARDSGHEPPSLQVTRLVEGVQTAIAQRGIVAPPPPPADMAVRTEEPVGEAEVAAHIQIVGDVLARLGNWVGEPGSQRWVEGFAVSPRDGGITPADIEYQAVLGRGWLSPWAEGGQYCGSRGMALPILGLRVRLRGEAAETHTVRIAATFTDGTSIGPVGPGDACEAESLAPLEAFQITVLPIEEEDAMPLQITPARLPSRAAPKPVTAPKRAPAPVAKPASKPVAKAASKPVAKPAAAPKRAAPAKPVVAAKKSAAKPAPARGRTVAAPAKPKRKGR
jgi:hypothetical protein